VTSFLHSEIARYYSSVKISIRDIFAKNVIHAGFFYLVMPVTESLCDVHK
jgi:hypothetical protein